MKLNNIVFSSPNSKEIRVIDFGISGLYIGSNPEKSLAGSLKYMAPEVLTGKNTSADPALDIFSMGCILFALVTGQLPFDGEISTVRENIINGKYSYPSDISLSESLIDLIDGMLKVNPRRRITMVGILDHPWLE